MSSEPQEVEVALLVAADDAPDVADSIARATSLAGYELAAREDQRLHDVHYDTAAHALQAQGFALRTRLRNGSQLITLKGAARRDGRGGVTRLEIEVPWSAEGFKTVAGELARAQIKLARPEAFDGVPPGDFLRAAGLIRIQDRQTTRRVRDVQDPERHIRLAELAIDTVSYRFGSTAVDLCEVEIEAKHHDGVGGRNPSSVARGHAEDMNPSAGVLHACAGALQTDFGAMLRPWPYGKLATGAAIERLLRTGELTPLLVNAQLVGARASLLLEDRLRT